MRRVCLFSASIALLFFAVEARATIFGNVRGIVHDPSHRPVPGAEVTLKAAASEWSNQTHTNANGSLTFQPCPRANTQSASRIGFRAEEQRLVVASGNAPVLHVQLSAGRPARVGRGVGDGTGIESAGIRRDDDQPQPHRADSRRGPEQQHGDDHRFVPGAYMSHDQLHVRGGHQVTWAIDGDSDPEHEYRQQRGAADRSQGHRLSGSAARRLFVRIRRPHIRRVQRRSAHRF